MNLTDQDNSSSTSDATNCFMQDIENPLDTKESDYHGAGSGVRDEKSLLKLKLQQILSCAVCLELRRSAMYQCKYGHLICAGCFGDIISESRLQNEIASCPNCQSTISKDLCSRNVAVEKTISELPMTCPHCFLQIAPDVYKTHKNKLCDKRRTVCDNSLIGCPWEGPFYKKSQHEEVCRQLSATGYEILHSLSVLDRETEEQIKLYDDIIELLSVESFLYFDLQFKQCMGEDCNAYETSKFSAFDNVWNVHGRFINEPFEFQYQLVLKSKLNVPLNLHYILLKGPYSEMEIKPKLCQFKFTEKTSESPFQVLNLCNQASSMQSHFQAKRINLRIFIFLNK